MHSLGAYHVHLSDPLSSETADTDGPDVRVKKARRSVACRWQGIASTPTSAGMRSSVTLVLLPFVRAAAYAPRSMSVPRPQGCVATAASLS